MNAIGAIEIAAPPERVFQLLTDPQWILAWESHTREWRYLDELDPANAVGQRFAWIVEKDDGEIHEQRGHITVWTPPTAFSFATQESGGEVLFDYRLQPVGGGTKLNARLRIQLPGCFSFILQSFAGKLLQKRLMAEMENLKRHAESGRDEPFAEG